MQIFNRDKKRFKITKWIFLGLSILLNGFIIYHSCLNSTDSGKWSSFFANIFEKQINENHKAPIETIAVTNLTVDYNSSYAYNNIAGYEDSGATHYLPVGCTKLVAVTIEPKNATNKAVTYTASNPELIKITQQGTGAAIQGVSAGLTTLTITSNGNPSLSKTFDFEVVDLKAPVDFSIPETSMDIPLNGGDIVPIEIINDDLTVKDYDKEVFLPRYYDVRELTYTSLDPSVVDVQDILGVKNVLVGKASGSTTVEVSNTQGIKHSITVNVGTSKTVEALPEKTDLVAYGDDMDQARTDNTVGYNLDIDDVIYTSLNPTLVFVNQQGRMIGYRKNSSEDVLGKIRVISKNDLTTYKDYQVKVTDHPLESFSLTPSVKPKDGVISIEVGKQMSVSIVVSPSNSYNNKFNIVSSNESVAKVTNQGSSFAVDILKEGNAIISVTNAKDENMKQSINISAYQKGAINDSNRGEFRQFVRKYSGHLMLFFITGIFTTITMYMFLDAKKWWIAPFASALHGFTIAGISELIQLIVPGRAGLWSDVGIDYMG
ncbi:MAG: VanZ family protein, partial [Bacilli bacterium]|nr:VanZ family protein [Bacilli bacterium]